MKEQNSAAKMAVLPVSGFSYAWYRATYHKPHRSRGIATLPEGARSATFTQRWALFREAKSRLEHGVPVGVLIHDVTMKLRVMKRGGVQ